MSYGAASNTNPKEVSLDEMPELFVNPGPGTSDSAVTDMEQLKSYKRPYRKSVTGCQSCKARRIKVRALVTSPPLSYNPKNYSVVGIDVHVTSKILLTNATVRRATASVCKLQEEISQCYLLRLQREDLESSERSICQLKIVEIFASCCTKTRKAGRIQTV